MTPGFSESLCTATAVTSVNDFFTQKRCRAGPMAFNADSVMGFSASHAFNSCTKSFARCISSCRLGPSYTPGGKTLRRDLVRRDVREARFKAISMRNELQRS